MNAPTKVLIVDDSAVVRNTLAEILESDPEITVIGTAADPFAAARRMRKQVPDVITLDIEMPRMDGLTFLRKLMHQHPLPVVVCSSLASEGGTSTLRALDAGAVDVIEKPKLGVPEFFAEFRVQICDVIKAAGRARVTRRTQREPARAAPKLTADAILAAGSTRAMAETTERVVVIGASTGGTEALRSVLEELPSRSPGIVVVQHMPEGFTAAFAKRLDSLCQVTVKEAESRDSVIPGRVLIAPGNHHTLLRRSGARYYVEVRDGPLVCRHRPSVDVLFRSAARYAGCNAIGVLLTGMGDDGARGMRELFDGGAFTVAQDEASCVVYGMPREAVRMGGVKRQVALSKIPHEILRAGRSS